MSNLTFYPWEAGVLTLGLDPAQKTTALAFRGKLKDGGSRRGTTLVGDILDAIEIEKTLKMITLEMDFERVLVAVEYPRWNAGAAQTVRASANTYVRLVRRIFPKAVVVKVDPNEWQGSYGYKTRGGMSTKEYSLLLAKAYGWDTLGQHDRADAALILEYIRIRHPAQTPKKTKRKSS